MFEFSFTEVTQWLGLVWWPFVRFTGFFIIAPVFGDTRVPVRVRALLALCLAILCSGMITDVPPLNPFSIQSYFFAFYQFSFGFIFGLAVKLFFTIFSVAGQALSMQMGLAMAVMNDPSSGSVAILDRIFTIVCFFLFLSFDAHLVILDIFTRSFEHWPLTTPYPFEGIKHVLSMFSWMMVTALLIAIPSMVIMLLSNVTFGFLGKVAPSLNIFTLGFPMTMSLGMVAITLSITGMGDIFFDLVIELINHLEIMMGL